MTAVANSGAHAQTLESFAVIAGSTITNSGTTTINGNVALSPGSATPGFPDVTISNGALYVANPVAVQAKNDLTAAYNVLQGRTGGTDLTGQDLGVVGPLAPGLYSFDSTAQLTGTLTLDAGGDPNAVFIFQIGSTLTTAAASTVALINQASGANVFFVVGSSATLGATTTFNGNILALANIALGTGANILCGSARTQVEAVTLLGNTITAPGATDDCDVVAIVEGTFTDELGPDATENETAIAAAIDAYVLGGGTLPLSFELLALLSPEELAEAFAQMSGETATGFVPTSATAMNGFLTTVLNPFGNDRLSPEDDRPVTIKALGYAEENRLEQSAAFAPPLRTWSIWGAIYGGQNETDGDPVAGTHARTSSGLSFAVGIDYAVAVDAVAGIAVSTGGTSFGLSEDMGSGRSNLVQAAIYGRKTAGPNYLAGALAYGWNDVTTDRYLDIAGDDHLRANYQAHTLAGRIEIGHRIDLPDNPSIPGDIALTPFAAVQVQGIATPAYGETVVSGLPMFALDYEARTSVVVRTELGATVEKRIAFGGDASLVLHARAAWVHDAWSNLGMAASFQALPGSSFTVYGAAPASDSLLVSAGAEMNVNRAISLAATFDGEFAAGSQTYGGKLRGRYSW